MILIMWYLDVPLKDQRWNIDSINSNEVIKFTSCVYVIHLLITQDEFRDLIEKSTQDNTSVKAQVKLCAQIAHV